MSDDFDKEAERERLREKYGSDAEDREETERMSELLLQGATMTNRHCDTCGSPIFRYQGQEFCPTCQMEEQGDAQATEGQQAEGQDAAGGGRGSAATDAESASTTDAGSAPEAGEGSVPSPSRAEATESTGPASREEAGQAASAESTRRSPAADQASSPDASQAAATGDRSAPTESDRPSSQSEAPSIEATRASLLRTLSQFADRAEATEDPRRAREHLETAKRAAETLRALPR